jgi:Domain of unknown function (DUF4388)
MLRGSLTDLAVVDLVQIPLGNQKTGELLIATEDQDARLYYADGKLIHATSGDRDGPAVIEAIVSWTEGEFEFRPDVLANVPSSGGDLNSKLYSAVNSFRVKVFVKPAGGNTEKIRKLLYDFLSVNDFANHACLLYVNGTMAICGAERADTPSWLESIRSSVLDIVASYPRKSLNRVLFEDSEGTLVVTCYPEDQSALFVAAKKGATLGAVSIAVDRLARKISDVRSK